MLARFCFARMGFVDAKRRREEGIGKGNIVPLVSAVGGVGDHFETVPHVLGTFATKVPPRRDNCEARNLIFVMLYKKPMDHFSSTGFILQATLHNSH